MLWGRTKVVRIDIWGKICKRRRGEDCKISYQMVRGEEWEIARETNNSQDRDTKEKRMQ